MHPEPPSNVITIISLQLSDFHLDPPLYALNGVKITPKLIPKKPTDNANREGSIKRFRTAIRSIIFLPNLNNFIHGATR